MLFLEHVPWTLSAWLEHQFAAQHGAMASTLAMVERALSVDIPLMNSSGLLHGDAHFGNILTDGQRLYFADLGLATSERFALSADESSYLRHNATLDRGYALSKWVNWLVKAFAPAVDSQANRFELVRAAARGQALDQLVPGFPSSVAEMVHRHAPIATLINDFYVKLHSEDRRAPYPHDQMEALSWGAGSAT